MGTYMVIYYTLGTVFCILYNYSYYRAICSLTLAQYSTQYIFMQSTRITDYSIIYRIKNGGIHHPYNWHSQCHIWQGKATWSLLIKTAFGRFNQLVSQTKPLVKQSMQQICASHVQFNKIFATIHD